MEDNKKMDLQQIKTGNNNISIITDDIIESIAKVKAFNSSQINNELYLLHKKLLNISKNKNKSHEVGIFWNLANPNEHHTILGSINGINMNDKNEVKQMVTYGSICSIAVLHNHPKNGLFSSRDIHSFADYDSIYLMTAVCNDGTIYMMRKERNFNPLLLVEYYNYGITNYIRKNNATNTKPYYSGIKYVAKHAKKIGITYRCSVKKKGGI